MKKLLVSCGTGIATSTAVRNKLINLLEQRGYGKDVVDVGQCRVADLPSFAHLYDLIISTSALPSTIETPYIMGLCFLTGIGMDKVLDDIVATLELDKEKEKVGK